MIILSREGFGSGRLAIMASTRANNFDGRLSRIAVSSTAAARPSFINFPAISLIEATPLPAPQVDATLGPRLQNSECVITGHSPNILPEPRQSVDKRIICDNPHSERYASHYVGRSRLVSGGGSNTASHWESIERLARFGQSAVRNDRKSVSRASPCLAINLAML
jgi:hypothetical protein